MNKFYHCCSLFCLVCGKSIVVDCECCYFVIQSNKDFLALCSFNFFEKYFINMHCLITLLLTYCFMHFFYFSTCCDYLLHIIKSMCKKDDIDRFLKAYCFPSSDRLMKKQQNQDTVFYNCQSIICRLQVYMYYSFNLLPTY